MKDGAHPPAKSGASAAERSFAGDGGRLRIDGVGHRYGTLDVLRNVGADIGAGEFLTLLGPSGSGKTTLLRIIGGLVAPLEGRIWLGGRDITRLPPERRDIGFVFQNYALFPHLTVGENVAFPLKVRGVAAAERGERTKEVLALVGLAGLGHRYPAQLSGGQQQRVALARAIVFRPGVLLLDEPLGALDRQLRQQLGLELRSLQRRSGITMVYVTHDQEEAFTMSTQVAVMDRGEILQIAPPQEIYRRPADLFVARFVGELNLFEAEMLGASGGVATLRLGDGALLQAAAESTPAAGARVLCGIRPEHVRVAAAGPAPENGLRARVATVIFGGSWHRLELAMEPGGATLRAEGRGEPLGVVEGSEVSIAIDPGGVLLFPPGSSTP